VNSDSTIITAPAALKTLDDVGIPLSLMRDILLKTMFRASTTLLTEIARQICLPIPLTTELIDVARAGKLVEALATLHATSNSDVGFQLTEAGQTRAQSALSQSEYFGAMPVPLSAYTQQVKRQSIRNIQISRQELTASMGDLVLPPNLIDDLGPAVSSGRSVLLYGPPGNGKSSISNGIRAAMGDHIYVPRALMYGGQPISVFDPVVHTKIAVSDDNPNLLRQTGTRFDNRYVLCQRPTVMTGGELLVSMLDLNFNAVARTYQASLQLKATGGVFIVDDLGRQEEPPQALVNRWIVPLEMGYDILTLQSGEKFVVPFDTLVIFSTNFHPNEIFDQAALRRIFYKIKIDGPDQADFLKIFAMVARKRKIPLNEQALVHLLQTKYPTLNNVYSNYQPIFLIDQMIAICRFEGKPNHMTPELIDRAWRNMFVRDEVIIK
jgi:predicted ATPase with chaperone activity